MTTFEHCVTRVIVKTYAVSVYSLWQIGTFCAAAGKRAYDAGYRVSPMTIGYLGYPLPVRNADPPAS